MPAIITTAIIAMPAVTKTIIAMPAVTITIIAMPAVTITTAAITTTITGVIRQNIQLGLPM